ncbi:MAG TPA: hypothetical protein VNY05_36935 [Candidatus Acidoferrales bacterium]|jgi:hypothetical protein|nr:hypothetical protein [Candidatus Acidoferrales bacterium]
MFDNLSFQRTGGHFADRYGKVSVFQVSGGRKGFAAFVYMCRLNLDLDGAPTTYGYDNPAQGSLQKNLAPLESWHKGAKGVSNATSEKVGLGNACGDPGDGSKGWQNFLNGTRNFYWAGLKAVSKQHNLALKLVIDDRPELEAGLETYARDGKPKLKPVGSGYFPVVQPDTGYYISGTSVVSEGSLSEFDSNRYLNSALVPYAVWAKQWNNLNIGGKKVQQGDFGLAIENITGANTGFVYGDSGTSNKVGECSEKLHNALGRGVGLVTFIAFPGSGSGPQLGPNPQALIPIKVLMNSLKLHTNAAELAARLAMGRELPAPKKTAGMSQEQTRLFNTFMSALSNWTIPR